jgi:hypothetical protein
MIRLHRWDIVGWLSCSIGLAVAVSASARVEPRVQHELLRAQQQASAWWMGLVQSGVPTDSATHRALDALRHRLERGSAAAMPYPFVERADADSLWQSYYLNPFLMRGAQTPRSSEEAAALQAAQPDLRLILVNGASALRARERARARRLSWVAAIVAGAAAIFSLRRRRQAGWLIAPHRSP